MRKNTLFTAVVVALVGIAAIAAVNNSTGPATQARDLKIQNTNNTVGLTIQKSGTQTANLFEIYSGSSLKVAWGSNGVPTRGMFSGTAISAADGTVTNTFPVAFSSVPVVVSTPFSASATITTNQITSITTTNFVVKNGAANVTNKWFAFGAP